METRSFTLLVASFWILGASALDWRSLHVKWDLVGGYYNIPTIKADVLDSDYYFMVRDEDLNLDFYSMNWDPRLSFGYDAEGNIAALRVGYIKSDVGTKAASLNVSFPTGIYENNPMYESGTFWDTDVWYNTVLFASPDVLLAGGRQYTNRVADDIYIKISGNWTLMPREEEEVEAMGFTKQACFVGMGLNYFYNLTSNSTCEDVQGISLMYESNQLIGIGLSPFGAYSSTDEITWFESVPNIAAKLITPDGPDCIKDWMSLYGISSIHIYLKKRPRLALCVWPWN